MPRWVQHARQLAGLQRRWNVNAAFSELATGVVPVVEVDKHRAADDQDIYGLLVQANSNVGQIEACALVSQTHEVLIHKIEFWWDPATSVSRPVHLFTPLQNYTPFDVSSAAFFAWFQGPANANDVGKLGHAFGVGGLGSGLQVVVVNGVPITTIGPAYPHLLTGVFATLQGVQPIWTFQDPPFRLKPFSMACVQSTNQLVESGHVLNVNFFYSERVAQGDVG